MEFLRKNIFEIIASCPPICWPVYFEAAAYKTIRAFEKGHFSNKKPVYLLTGFTDRLIVLNQLLVYMQRREKTGLVVNWLVNKGCEFPCPEKLILSCHPHLEIVNDYSFPDSRWFDTSWPRSGPLKHILKFFREGRICFGQSIERQPLSIDKEILPFTEMLRKQLGVYNESDLFSIHIRGGDFAAAQNDRALEKSAKSLKSIVKGKKVMVFSDDEVLAEEYCKELTNYGIHHTKSVGTSTGNQQEHTISDFCKIASSNGIFVARKKMGKFASYAAFVGGVEDIYVIGFDGEIRKKDNYQLMRWYTRLSCPSVIRYYVRQVKWRIKFIKQNYF